MSDVKQAVGYQQISALFQRQDGKRFLEDARPRPGDAVLDLGCGTGELSAFLAQLVGQEGNVVAVDPDIDRIQMAQKSHKSVKNLVFLPRDGDRNLRLHFLQLCAGLDSRQGRAIQKHVQQPQTNRKDRSAVQ